MATSNTTFGDRIRAYRAKRGLTYRQAEAASGVNKANILRVENGVEPSLQTFCGLVLWAGMGADAIKQAVREFGARANRGA